MRWIPTLALIAIVSLCGGPRPALAQDEAPSPSDPEIKLAAEVSVRTWLALGTSGYALAKDSPIGRDGFEKVLAPLGPDVVRRLVADFVWAIHGETKHKQRTNERAFVTVFRSRTPEAAQELVRQLTLVGKRQDEEMRKAGVLVGVEYSEVRPPGASAAVASVREIKTEVRTIKAAKIVFAVGPLTYEVALFDGGKPELKSLTDAILHQVRTLF